MNIITAYATKNDCYKAARKMKPAGIVVHSTGANNPYLKRYVDAPDEVGVNQYGNHWNNPASVMKRSVCVHSFIGYDKNGAVRVANILPYNYCCWGVGSGSKGSYNYNPAYIQFEMCEDGLTNKAYFEAVREKIEAYTASLTDDVLLEKPENCEYARFTCILAQFRHLHTQLGMLMGFLIGDTGEWPFVLGLERSIPDGGFGTFF